jgi:hypothetical protein
MKEFLFFFLLIEILCKDKIDFYANITNGKEAIKDYSINDNKNNKRNLQNFQPIRIYIDKSYLNRSEASDYYIYEKAIDKVTTALEKLIKVIPESSIDLTTINLRDHKFKSAFIDNNLMGNQNFPYDLAIFVRENDGNEIGLCDEKQEILLKNNQGRPIIGYIVINTMLLYKTEENDRYKIEFLSYLFLHQITHILGFSKSIIDNRAGITIENVDINRIDNSADKIVHKKRISGQNIRNKIKEYFNCDSLTGIELEDYSLSDCDYHWEARILSGDYMTGLVNVQDQVISEFTLALLKDTGF